MCVFEAPATTHQQHHCCRTPDISQPFGGLPLSPAWRMYSRDIKLNTTYTSSPVSLAIPFPLCSLKSKILVSNIKPVGLLMCFNTENSGLGESLARRTLGLEISLRPSLCRPSEAPAEPLDSLLTVGGRPYD